MTKGEKIISIGAGLVFISFIILIYFPIFFARDNKEYVFSSFSLAIIIMYVAFIPYSIYMIKKMSRIYYIHKYRIFGVIIFDIIITVMFSIFVYENYLT